ncbi:MAG: HIT family protein [Bacteroidia bacterium]
MSSIFSKIIIGEIPCHKITEDDDHMAFLDIMPLKKGHVLVIPKLPIDNIFDMAPADFAALHLFAQKVAKAISAAISCKKVGVAVVGLEVPHAHIHLIPINSVSDIDFSKEKMKPSHDELEATAHLIKKFL